MEGKRQRTQRESKKETNPKISSSVTERNNKTGDRNSWTVTSCREERETLCRKWGRQVSTEVAVRKIFREKVHTKAVGDRGWVGGYGRDSEKQRVLSAERHLRDTGAAASDGPDVLPPPAPRKAVSARHPLSTAETQWECGDEVQERKKGFQKHPHKHGARTLISHSTRKPSQPTIHPEASCPLALHSQLNRVIIGTIVPYRLFNLCFSCGWVLFLLIVCTFLYHFCYICCRAPILLSMYSTLYSFLF